MSRLPHQVYLLAAGRGARAGGPKAWREHEGRPLLQRQLDFLLGLFEPERIAVSIQADWSERCRALHGKVRWVPENPDAPPMEAIQALAKAAPMERWTFLYHVDMPVWEAGLFEALSERAVSADGVEAFAPVKGGSKGHPVLLSPSLQAALLGLDAGRDRLDHWLRGRREEAVEVPYDCIHSNWNELPAA